MSPQCLSCAAAAADAVAVVDDDAAAAAAAVVVAAAAPWAICAVRSWVFQVGDNGGEAQLLEYACTVQPLPIRVFC